MAHIVGYSAISVSSPSSARSLTNNYGTSINTTVFSLPDTPLIITQSEAPETENITHYKNGYINIIIDNLIFDHYYDISFKITNIINNPLNASLQNIQLMGPNGSGKLASIIQGDCLIFRNFAYKLNTSFPNRRDFSIRICGMSFTLSEFMVTTVDAEDRTFEPYCGETINYEFGVLGKNKFNWNVEEANASPTTSDYTTPRMFTLGTYVVGMSVNNYYRQNYTNWVLSPSISDGTISFSSGGASGYGIAFPMKLAAGQTYFLSGTGNGTAGATYYDKDGNVISYQNGRLNNTITIPANTATTLIGFYASTSNTAFSFSNIQLELGSTATAYKSYDPKHTVYGGWVDLITGKVQEEYIKFSLQTGTWSYNSSITGFMAKGFASSLDINNLIYYNNIYKQVDSTTELKNEDYSIMISSQGIIAIRDIRYGTDASAFTQHLANDNYEFIAKLNPLLVNTYTIAPIQLQTFLGHNNVWSNADYVKVEYDLHETQDLLNRKALIIANQPHLKTVGGGIASFNTDMKAPLKQCKIEFLPVQGGSGDPSPSNVRPISGWTECEVYCAEKVYKCIPTSGSKWTENGITIEHLGYGKYHIYGIITDSAAFSAVIPINPFTIPSGSSGGQLWFNNSSINGYMYILYADGSKIDDWSLTTANRKATSYSAMSNKQMGALKFYLYAGTYDVYIEPVFLYNYKDTHAVNWQSTIYGGYVDLVTGELQQDWVSVTLDGSQTIQARETYTNTNAFRVPKSQLLIPPTRFLSDEYATYMRVLDSSNETPGNTPWTFYLAVASQSIYMFFPKTYTTVNQVTNYLTNNPLQICYGLTQL